MSHFEAEMSCNKMSDDVTMCSTSLVLQSITVKKPHHFSCQWESCKWLLAQKEQNDKHFLSRYLHHYRDGNYIAGICICSDLSLVVFEVPRVSQMTCHV